MHNEVKRVGLIAGIDFIINQLRRGWCREDPAQDAEGHEVPVNDPSACRWCLFGAACLLEDNEVWWHIDRHCRLNLQLSAITFNDHCDSVDEVIAFLEGCK